ncbi:Rossmann-like domain-containing protein [Ferrimonas lipolytica]|uniref:Putative heavy-metal chelation domain-containing protein n=1 Tax=Ferrimonas lipolytica TaxID=2724191 RepID=A0A6H1UCC0_9GAMM|nr:DUF364 domain-containing protein [Ferrimonas lipolytica]QIZ76725.1 hypothetical protein HER31_07470 [Ferrimonas lipolytica]
MNSIYQQLLASAPADLPTIGAIHLCSDQNNPSAKFGAIELSDGTIGLTYVKLGNAFIELQDSSLYQPFIGKPVIELAQLSLSDLDWQQVLGAGALNAISQYVLKQRGFNYHNAEDSLELLDIQPGERVGMVGYFAPLIAQLREQMTPLTVIELRQDLVMSSDNFEVTTDPSKLTQCDKVLITGTSVINHTLEGLLQHCRNAKEIALVGPSVGLLPEVLFAHGITRIGGRAVVDSERFLQRWQSGEKWQDSVTRYSLRNSDYHA